MVEQPEHGPRWTAPAVGRAAGRFEAGDGLEGDRVHAIAHAAAGRPRIGAAGVPDAFGWHGARGCHLEAWTAQCHGDGPDTSLSPAILESSCPLAIAGSDLTMDRVQVKKSAKPYLNWNPDVHK
ncbi:hypothetical protein Sm713_25200 [Streptomyces sp. TS71-3]|nr:hypothetical protein Sm713_25200 [Streptomyces sp. TS71-3]